MLYLVNQFFDLNFSYMKNNFQRNELSKIINIKKSVFVPADHPETAQQPA